MKDIGFAENVLLNVGLVSIVREETTVFTIILPHQSSDMRLQMKEVTAIVVLTIENDKD